MKNMFMGIIVGALCLSPVFAQCPGGGDGMQMMEGEGMMEGHGAQMMQEEKTDWRAYLTKELNLTNDQADKIDAIKNKYKPELTKLRDEKWKLRDELRKMSQKPEKGKAFQEKLSEAHDELLDAQEEYSEKRFEMMLEAREVLNAEQIANLDDVMKRKWKYHKWKHHSSKKMQAQEKEEAATKPSKEKKAN